MKKLLCLFLIVIAYFANSQDFEPTQVKFNWGIGGNETYLSADSAYFKQDKFLRGWHWGASKNISHAVGANQKDAHSYVTAEELDSNCLIILKPDVEYTHGNEDRILNARAIQYEPTLLLNSNNPSNLVIRQGDTTRPVFGFLNRRGRILTDSTDPNFNRLIIDSAELVNEVILSEPWPSNQLSLALIGTNPDSTTLNNYLCETLIFSINLRRAGSEMNNDTVLKIELPYTYLADSSYIIPPDSVTIHHKTVSRYANIKFATVPFPSQYPSGTYELANGRGCIRNTIPADTGVVAVCITKQMLPPNSKDITISASFRLNDNKRDNPLLKDESSIVDRIDSIKIKITYLGGGPLMIDWVRLESPHAKNFLSGDFDSLLTAKVQVDLNKIIAAPFSDKGIKLFRYNPVIEGRLHSWIAEKYYNKLIGNISTNEANKVIYPAHYEYYVNSPNRWFGTWACKSHISVPYSKKVYEINTENKAKTMGLFNGYNGMHEGEIETDTTKIHYETYLINQGDGVDLDHFLNNPIDRAEYEQVMNTQNNYWRASFQAYIEDYLYNHFLKESTKGFLFSDKFWWNQGFVHLTWKKDTNYLPIYDPIKPTAAHFKDHRPLTGEEFRYFVGSGLILGAKGIFYDGGETNYDSSKTQFYDGDCISPATRTILEDLPDDEFLDSEIAGPDFIRTENEILKLNERLYYLDTIAKYLDRPKDKLYVGRRSLRKEMKRVHDQIRRCENELMKLRLVAWMGKGFRLWNNHHPDYPANVLSQYLAWDTTRNRIDTTRFTSNKI